MESVTIYGWLCVYVCVCVCVCVLCGHTENAVIVSVWHIALLLCTYFHLEEVQSLWRIALITTRFRYVHAFTLKMLSVSDILH